MMYVRFLLSLRNVEDLLHERGIDISYETDRYWWNKFAPLFARKVRKKRMQPIPNYFNWRWHVDEVFVKIRENTISGVPLIMKVRFWRLMFPELETRNGKMAK